MASGTQHSTSPNPRTRFSTRVTDFWQRVTDGLEVNQLWSQFEKDARSSYRLYNRGLTESDPRESRAKRFLFTVKQLFWAILEKLSPARRVLLLAALVMLLFPTSGITFRDEGGDIHGISLDLHFLAGIVLFVVLILEVADRVVMKRDLEIARDIQTWLLPGAPPQIPGISMAYMTRPANTVAGDYYDVFPRPGAIPEDDRVFLIVADVAGKSIPAAMLMATLQASLRTLSNTPSSLSQIVSGLNQYACSNSQGGTRFTTAFIAELDPVTRKLTYINAGHNAPILRRFSGAIERFETGGLPLGILLNSNYESATVSLETNDWLLIFTDGLVEAMNTSGEEFGEARVLEQLHHCANTAPADALKRMISSVDAFVGNTPQHDDVTAMLLKFS
ncbi:MAG TPA: PP2C family protein-serine/threonine phosphatase [Terriglobales bacterium]|jgi:phosphoserine phosphatase RsbU/P|nr:PP2C family protein-serine/threonine phosphatase [Terriglobales bacterium]